MQSKIVLASSNKHKIVELTPLLAPLHLTLLPQSTFEIPEHEETALSFIENAISKARWASKYTELPAIGDDSGLVVKALSGRPGIYSRRFAGTNATDDENIDKLLSDLDNISNREAFFYCAMAYVKAHDDPTPVMALAQFNGTILRKRVGVRGFGYDPVFFVPNLNKTAAELEPSHKNDISHRGQATKRLIQQLKEMQ